MEPSFAVSSFVVTELLFTVRALAPVAFSASLTSSIPPFVMEVLEALAVKSFVLIFPPSTLRAFSPVAWVEAT